MRAMAILLQATVSFLVFHTSGCARDRTLLESSSFDAAASDAEISGAGVDAAMGSRDGGDACRSLASLPDKPGCPRTLAEIEVACACLLPRGWQCRWIRIQFDPSGRFVAIEADRYGRAGASAEEAAAYLSCFEDRLRAQEWQCVAGTTVAFMLDMLACVGP